MAVLRGFDVSHYQGAVDWESLKSRYGITWGAAKATEATGIKDSQFPANWKKMKAAGLVRMAYHFAHPDSDPADDAKVFLDYVNAAGGFGPEDVAVMDMEGNPHNLPMLQVRDWLAGWADIVAKATGRKPFLYCGSGYIQNNATKDLKSHYAAWWYPQYPSRYNGSSLWPGSIVGYPTTNNWGGAPDIWQFSQSFAGSKDADIANMTLADLKTRGSNTIITPPSTTEDELSAAEVTDLKNFIEYTVQRYSAFNAKNLSQQLETLEADLDKITQKYAIAVNNFTQQSGNVQSLNLEHDLSPLFDGLKAQVTDLKAAVTSAQTAAAATAPVAEAEAPQA